MPGWPVALDKPVPNPDKPKAKEPPVPKAASEPAAAPESEAAPPTPAEPMAPARKVRGAEAAATDTFYSEPAAANAVVGTAALKLSVSDTAESEEEDFDC